MKDLTEIDLRWKFRPLTKVVAKEVDEVIARSGASASPDEERGRAKGHP